MLLVGVLGWTCNFPRFSSLWAILYFKGVTEMNFQIFGNDSKPKILLA